MQDKNSYNQEGIYQTTSVKTRNVNRVIMIPYGYPKNFRLVDQSRPGETIVFKDNKPTKSKQNAW